MRFVLGIALVLALIAGAALAIVYSGAVDVAATYPHAALTQKILHGAMKRSVKAHAHEVPPQPAGVTALRESGATLYREMCAQCHGAPGVKPDELGSGLMPAAPDLALTAGDWTLQELFWIIKNGVRFTGMPAWGKTHSDAQIWAMSAFVAALPGMTPAEYRTLSGGEPLRAHNHVARDAHHHSNESDGGNDADRRGNPPGR